MQTARVVLPEIALAALISATTVRYTGINNTDLGSDYSISMHDSSTLPVLL